MKQKMTPVHHLADVPHFATDDEAAAFWESHEVTEEYLDDERLRLLAEIRQAAKAKGLNLRVEPRDSTQGPPFIDLRTTEGDGEVEYLPKGMAEPELRIRTLRAVLTRVRKL
ncbi:MAG TPA: hypothetical protein VK821_17105 [Dehalococcoidia bacterium]|nr:hypothetical protein [Dehalococcoidia bacterium]